MVYRIEYSPDAVEHLGRLSVRQQRAILDGVERRLADRPTVETRNRKPMRPNPVAPWELRLGVLRVYYDVTEEPERAVLIRAVGIKDRDRVVIGGEVIKL